MDHLAGMNTWTKSPSDTCRALTVKEAKPLIERKIVLIATAIIQDESFFVNGLYQNIFFIYKMLDAMGYAPILLVNEKPKDIQKVPDIMRHVRMLVVEEVMTGSIPIHLYLEIGMSIDPLYRKRLRASGTKIAKLYLGNILNIDIETPIFYPAMLFSHHVVGELDEIWVSPHYKQHDEYAAVLNHVKPEPTSMKIAPYIWDPCVLTLNGSRNLKWRPRRAGETETFLIIEPNISFQKSSLVPILIAERNYRANKRPVEVLVGNGDKLLANAFFTATILPNLELMKDGMIHFGGRHAITTLMEDYPHATAICHQWNNQYNYMTLEFVYAGFPIIHNAPDWHDIGYYYDGNDVEKGEAALLTAIQCHAQNLDIYKGGAEAVRWRHSIYNPEVQAAWASLCA